MGQSITFDQEIESNIDTYKKFIIATIKAANIKEVAKILNRITKSFEDMQMRDWLQSEGIIHFAMESTRVYRKPLFNILEKVLINYFGQYPSYFILKCAGSKDRRKDS